MPDVAEAIGRLQGRRIAVMGDFILERTQCGRPEQVSREAPVLVLRHESESSMAGGAGRLACLLAGLGAEVLPLGAVGADAAGDQLLELVAQISPHCEGLLKVRSRETAVQTRFLAGDIGVRKQQVLRIDRGDAHPLDDASAARLLAEAQRCAGDVAGWVFVEGGYGLLSRALIEGVRGVAQGFCFADAGERARDFAGISHLALNSREAARQLGLPRLTEAAAAARQLRTELGLQGLLLTRGSAGMLAVCGDQLCELEAIGGEQVVDPSGAGDAVSLGATVGLASGWSWADTARLANLAASVAIMQQGPARCGAEELRAAAREAGW